MSRQYTDSSDELCPLGGKRKFCTESVPINWHIGVSGNDDINVCGKNDNAGFYHTNRISYNMSEWTESEGIARASKTISDRWGSISCSGTKISSCGASGSDVWYKK